MGLRRDGDDRIERTRDEVRELQLDDRSLANPGGPDRRADEALLRDGRVDHALLAELVQQAGGDAEGAAEDPDVLAEEEDPIVLEQRVPQRSADCLEVRGLPCGGLGRRSARRR
jgi:hypothetical protein